MSKIKKYIPFVTLPIILLVCFWLWSNLHDERPITTPTYNGVWDLREVNFDGAFASLHGPVETIPGVLSPEEFAALEDDAKLVYPHITDTPSTVRVRIFVSEDKEYLLSRISSGYSDRIYVNGQWQRDIGSPDENRIDEPLLSDTITFTARPLNGVIEIVHLQSNFVYHVYGVYHDGILDAHTYGSASQRTELGTAVMLGVFLSLAVISLFLYFQYNRFWPALLFSLLCLSYFIYTGVTTTKPFIALFPYLTDPVRIRLLNLHVPIISIFTAIIILGMFPKLLHKHVIRAYIAVQSAWMIYFMFGDLPLISGTLLWVCLGTSFLGFIYILCCMVVRLRNTDAVQKVFVIGLLLYTYASMRDIFAYIPVHLGQFRLLLPPFEGANFARIGIVALLFCQAVAIFTTTIKEMEKAKESEQRLATEKAALDNLSKIKSAFIADISHEIKSPLGIMSGYAELAELQIDKGTANEDTKENLRIVSEEAHRLAQLVEKLLKVSESSEDAAIPLPISVGDIISRATAVLAPVLAANRNRLEVSVEEDMPPIAANADMLLQVLFNLGGNANRHCKDSVIELNVKRSEDFVAFTVTDKGAGIPPHVLSKIFERGVSGDNSSGLGLPICKEAVEAYGGSIHIESKPGKGTTACFTLPIYEEREVNL